jgi:hypothetical protein
MVLRELCSEVNEGRPSEEINIPQQQTTALPRAQQEQQAVIYNVWERGRQHGREQMKGEKDERGGEE